MADPRKNDPIGLNSPARNAFAITPDDATDLAVATRGIYVGVSGDLRIAMVNDAAPVTLVGAAVGYHPLCVRRVYATSTTAASLIGVY